MGDILTAADTHLAELEAHLTHPLPDVQPQLDQFLTRLQSWTTAATEWLHRLEQAEANLANTPTE